MDPHALFQIANPLALAGWLLLAASPWIPRLADAVAGYAIPLVLSLGYTALMLVHWAGAEGGYGSLADVMRLFEQTGIALAGWVHFLAFDLFVGGWIVRQARAAAVPHLLVLPCLALAFLFGPAGLLAFLALRTARTRILPQRAAGEA
jgi:hypothetical protein